MEKFSTEDLRRLLFVSIVTDALTEKGLPEKTAQDCAERLCGKWLAGKDFQTGTLAEEFANGIVDRLNGTFADCADDEAEDETYSSSINDMLTENPKDFVERVEATVAASMRNWLENEGYDFD